MTTILSNLDKLNSDELMEIAQTYTDNYTAYNFLRTLSLEDEIRGLLATSGSMLIVGGYEVEKYFAELGVRYTRFEDCSTDDYFIFNDGMEPEDEIEFEGWVYNATDWEERIQYAKKMLIEEAP